MDCCFKAEQCLAFVANYLTMAKACFGKHLIARYVMAAQLKAALIGLHLRILVHFVFFR